MSDGSVHNTQRFAHLFKGVQGAVEVSARVGGTQLNADARLPLRHHRVGERGDVHALVEHRVGDPGRERGVAV